LSPKFSPNLRPGQIKAQDGEIAVSLPGAYLWKLSRSRLPDENVLPPHPVPRAGFHKGLLTVTSSAGAFFSRNSRAEDDAGLISFFVKSGLQFWLPM